MKQITAFLVLLFSIAGWSTSAHAQRENRSIGENGREAKKAAKQQRKATNKQARNQRKAMKKYQKAQRKAAKQQQHRRT